MLSDVVAFLPTCLPCPLALPPFLDSLTVRTGGAPSSIVAGDQTLLASTRVPLSTAAGGGGGGGGGSGLEDEGPSPTKPVPPPHPHRLAPGAAAAAPAVAATTRTNGQGVGQSSSDDATALPGHLVTDAQRAEWWKMQCEVGLQRMTIGYQNRLQHLGAMLKTTLAEMSGDSVLAALATSEATAPFLLARVEEILIGSMEAEREHMLLQLLQRIAHKDSEIEYMRGQWAEFHRKLHERDRLVQTHDNLASDQIAQVTDALRRRIAELEGDNGELADRLAEVQQEAQMARNRVAELQTQVAELKGAAGSADHHHQSMAMQMQYMQQQLDQSRVEAESLRQRLNESIAEQDKNDNDRNAHLQRRQSAAAAQAELAAAAQVSKEMAELRAQQAELQQQLREHVGVEVQRRRQAEFEERQRAILEQWKAQEAELVNQVRRLTAQVEQQQNQVHADPASVEFQAQVDERHRELRRVFEARADDLERGFRERRKAETEAAQQVQDRLQEQLDAANKELNRLQESLESGEHRAELEALNANWEERIALVLKASKDRLDLARERVDAAERAAREAAQDLADSKRRMAQDVAAFRQDHSDLESKHAVVKDQLAKAQSLLAVSERERLELRKKYVAIGEKMEVLLKVDQQRHAQELAAEQAKKRRLREQVNELKRRRAAEQESARIREADMLATVETLRRDLADRQSSIEKLQARADVAIEERAQAIADRDAARSDLALSHQQFDARMKEAEDVISDRDLQLRNAQESRTDQESEHRRQLKEQRRSFLDQIDDLKRAMEEEKAVVVRQHQTMLAIKIQETRAEALKAHEAAAIENAIQEKLANIDRQFMSPEQHELKLQEVCRQLESELYNKFDDERRQILEKADLERQEMRAKLISEHEEALRNQNQKHQVEVQACVKELESAADQTQEAVGREKERRKKAERTVAAEQARAAELTTNLAEARGQLQAMELTKSTLMAHLDEATQRADSLRSEVADAQQKISTLESDLSSAQDQLAAKTQENAQLLQERNALFQDVSQGGMEFGTSLDLSGGDTFAGASRILDFGSPRSQAPPGSAPGAAGSLLQAKRAREYHMLVERLAQAEQDRDSAQRDLAQVQQESIRLTQEKVTLEAKYTAESRVVADVQKLLEDRLESERERSRTVADDVRKEFQAKLDSLQADHLREMQDLRLQFQRDESDMKKSSAQQVEDMQRKLEQQHAAAQQAEAADRESERVRNREELDRIQRELASEKSRAESLRDQLSVLKAQVSVHENQQDQRSAEQVQQLERSETALKKQVADLQEQLNASKLEALQLVSAEKQAAAMSLAEHKAAASLAQQEKSVAEETVRRLREQLMSAEDEARQANALVKSKEAEIAAKSAEVVELGVAKKVAETENAKLRAELSAIESSLTEVKAHHRRVSGISEDKVSQLRQEMGSSLSSTQQALVAEQMAHNALKQQMDVIQAQHTEKLKQMNTDHANALQQAEQTGRDYADRAHAEELERITRRLTLNSQDEMESLKRKAIRLRERVSDLTASRLKQMKVELADLKVSWSSDVQKMTDAAQDVAQRVSAQASAAVRMMDQQIKKLKRQVSDAEEELEESQQQLKAKDTEMATHIKELAVCQSRLEAVHAKLDAVKTIQAEDNQERMESTAAAQSLITVQLATVKNKLAAATADVQSHQQARVSAEEAARVLEQKLKAVLDRQQDLEHKLDTANIRALQAAQIAGLDDIVEEIQAQQEDPVDSASHFGTISGDDDNYAEDGAGGGGGGGDDENDFSEDPTQDSSAGLTTRRLRERAHRRNDSMLDSEVGGSQDPESATMNRRRHLAEMMTSTAPSMHAEPLTSPSSAENRRPPKERVASAARRRLAVVSRTVKEWQARYASAKQRSDANASKTHDLETELLSMQEKYSALSEEKRNAMNTIDELRGQLNKKDQEIAALRREHRKMKERVNHLGSAKPLNVTEVNLQQLEVTSHSPMPRLNRASSLGGQPEDSQSMFLSPPESGQVVSTPQTEPHSNHAGLPRRRSEMVRRKGHRRRATIGGSGEMVFDNLEDSGRSTAVPQPIKLDDSFNSPAVVVTEDAITRHDQGLPVVLEGNESDLSDSRGALHNAQPHLRPSGRVSPSVASVAMLHPVSEALQMTVEDVINPEAHQELQDQYDSLQHRFNSLEEKTQKLEADMQSAQAELKSAQADCAEAQSEVTRLTSEKKEAAAAADATKAELSKVEGLLADSDAEITELKSAVTQATDRADSAHTTLEQYQTRACSVIDIVCQSINLDEGPAQALLAGVADQSQEGKDADGDGAVEGDTNVPSRISFDDAFNVLEEALAAFRRENDQQVKMESRTASPMPNDSQTSTKDRGDDLQPGAAAAAAEDAQQASGGGRDAIIAYLQSQLSSTQAELAEAKRNAVPQEQHVTGQSAASALAEGVPAELPASTSANGDEQMVPKSLLRTVQERANDLQSQLDLAQAQLTMLEEHKSGNSNSDALGRSSSGVADRERANTLQAELNLVRAQLSVLQEQNKANENATDDNTSKDLQMRHDLLQTELETTRSELQMLKVQQNTSDAPAGSAASSAQLEAAQQLATSAQNFASHLQQQLDIAQARLAEYETAGPADNTTVVQLQKQVSASEAVVRSAQQRASMLQLQVDSLTAQVKQYQSSSGHGGQDALTLSASGEVDSIAHQNAMQLAHVAQQRADNLQQQLDASEAKLATSLAQQNTAQARLADSQQQVELLKTLMMHQQQHRSVTPNPGPPSVGSLPDSRSVSVDMELMAAPYEETLNTRLLELELNRVDAQRSLKDEIVLLRQTIVDMEKLHAIALEEKDLEMHDRLVAQQREWEAWAQQQIREFQAQQEQHNHGGKSSGQFIPDEEEVDGAEGSDSRDADTDAKSDGGGGASDRPHGDKLTRSELGPSNDAGFKNMGADDKFRTPVARESNFATGRHDVRVMSAGVRLDAAGDENADSSWRWEWRVGQDAGDASFGSAALAQSAPIGTGSLRRRTPLSSIRSRQRTPRSPSAFLRRKQEELRRKQEVEDEESAALPSRPPLHPVPLAASFNNRFPDGSTPNSLSNSMSYSGLASSSLALSRSRRRRRRRPKSRFLQSRSASKKRAIAHVGMDALRGAHQSLLDVSSVLHDKELLDALAESGKRDQVQSRVLRIDNLRSRLEAAIGQIANAEVDPDDGDVTSGFMKEVDVPIIDEQLSEIHAASASIGPGAVLAAEREEKMEQEGESNAEPNTKHDTNRASPSSRDDQQLLEALTGESMPSSASASTSAEPASAAVAGASAVQAEREREREREREGEGEGEGEGEHDDNDDDDDDFRVSGPVQPETGTIKGRPQVGERLNE